VWLLPQVLVSRRDDILIYLLYAGQGQAGRAVPPAHKTKTAPPHNWWLFWPSFSYKLRPQSGLRWIGNGRQFCQLRTSILIREVTMFAFVSIRTWNGKLASDRPNL